MNAGCPKRITQPDREPEAPRLQCVGRHTIRCRLLAVNTRILMDLESKYVLGYYLPSNLCPVDTVGDKHKIYDLKGECNGIC